MLRGQTKYFLVLLIMNIKFAIIVCERKVIVPIKPSYMEGKIVGGGPVSLDNFPSMVQLYNEGNMCAGNIINSWTVLTAAHCFDLNWDVDEMVIQIGTRYVYDFHAKSYGVQSLVIHHEYNETQNFACDIALMFLDMPIQFTKYSKKGILAFNTRWMNRRESNFTVTGWGWTKYGGFVSKKGLMMARLRYIPSKECSRLHALPFTKDMFCLYGEGTRDTCKGDSGGGVLWHGMIVGLTSHGDGCAKKHKPSVYTNVYYFREWIHYHVNEFMQSFCKPTDKAEDRLEFN